MTQQAFEKHVRTLKNELVRTIRNHSKQQKRLWQKVPYLALHADGRRGYNDAYARAYRDGYWTLEGSVRDGHYYVCVDLETGRLRSAYDRRQTARNEDVLKLAIRPWELDAQSIVAELTKETKESFSPIYRSEDRARRQQRINALLSGGGITKETYSRMARK